MGGVYDVHQTENKFNGETWKPDFENVGIDRIIFKFIFIKWTRCEVDSLGSGWALVNTVMNIQVPYKWDTSYGTKNFSVRTAPWSCLVGQEVNTGWNSLSSVTADCGR